MDDTKQTKNTEKKKRSIKIGKTWMEGNVGKMRMVGELYEDDKQA